MQYDQEAEIKSLEEEVQQMRAIHSETIQKLKAQFLQEKKLFQDQSDTRIQAMAKQANQASCIFLQVSYTCMTLSIYITIEIIYYRNFNDPERGPQGSVHT